MSGSRLSAVQKTILGQIKDMKEKNPDRKVGLVTFTDYIDIIGDGTQASNTVTGKQLDDYNFILKNATTGASNLLSKEIGKTHDDLARRV
jgi:hypothetical protein